MPVVGALVGMGEVSALVDISVIIDSETTGFNWVEIGVRVSVSEICVLVGIEEVSALADISVIIDSETAGFDWVEIGAIVGTDVRSGVLSPVGDSFSYEAVSIDSGPILVRF